MCTCLPSLHVRRRWQEREARKAAEQEAEARSGEVRGLERRLAAALTATASAEQSAAASIEVGSLVEACWAVLVLGYPPVVVICSTKPESRH